MRTTRRDSFKGIIIATVILCAWLWHLWTALTLPLASVHPAFIAAMLVLQTFLYTGLFITAHDAMHGSVCRHYRRLNTAIGFVAVTLYALFSYKKLWFKHWEHHRHVATPNADPDFHDGEHTGVVRWYAHFLLTYISWQQLVGMALVFNILTRFMGLAVENVLLFWVFPALASTVQLFYFGTYLPHREPEDGHHNAHRSNPNNWHVLWSFLACYHFGYHYEHHDSPATPWWKLPALHRAMSGEPQSGGLW
jgi:beta-carotene ketolase (CrtW type)